MHQISTLFLPGNIFNFHEQIKRNQIIKVLGVKYLKLKVQAIQEILFHIMYLFSHY